jgi:hypothetical protein
MSITYNEDIDIDPPSCDESFVPTPSIAKTDKLKNENNISTNIGIKAVNKRPPSVKTIAPTTTIKQPDLINNFEKKLKNNFDYNYENLEDSDYEEDMLKEDIEENALIDRKQLVQRYKLLQNKINEKNKQLSAFRFTIEENKKKHDEFILHISKDTGTELKDKKIIELARKNQDLGLKIEKFKLQVKEYEKKLSSMPKDNNMKEQTALEPIKEIPKEDDKKDEIFELKKKLKLAEQKLSDSINKLQLAKEENTKLNVIIKREIGDIDLDKALKDKNFWRGRSEQIEILKCKIKSLESQLINSSGTDIDNKSIMTTKNTVSFSEYKKEKEQYKLEIEKLNQDNTKLTSDLGRYRSRKEVLEKELKSQKDDLTAKIRVLLEKNDNDEKLISALTKELQKKGSAVATGLRVDPGFNLQQENVKLRTELKEKEDYINTINAHFVTDKESKFNAQSLAILLNKMKELEKENKRLKNQSEEGNVYDAIAKENVKLRLKIKDLEDRIDGNV